MSDKFDKLNLIGLKEEPGLVEDCMISEQLLSESEPTADAILTAIYLRANREQDFERFLYSRDFQVSLKLLNLFGANSNKKICEIGGGPGFLSWALHRSGYTSVDLLEPNNYWTTGTAYLRSRADSRNIKIFKDTPLWHGGAENYDAFITKNCIHHFQNMTLAAATLRQKLQPNGLWFAFREWFADTPEEVAEAVSSHPYCQKYGLYEWPYPAAQYVESFALAGLKLVAIVPASYENDCLATYSESALSQADKLRSAEFDELLKNDPEQTVVSFWKEVTRVRGGDFTSRLYTRPQLMVFRKTPV